MCPTASGISSSRPCAPATSACSSRLSPRLPDSIPPPPPPQPEPCRRGDLAWQCVRLRAEDCLQPPRRAKIAELIRAFDPDLLAGAGTLLPSATACAVAGARPVWADLFGDPLAEIQAKADLLAGAFSLDEHLHVWRLMIEVLARADAFSTVSRRQADALLGQLGLTGRLGDPLPPIHPIPCSLESLDLAEDGPAAENPSPADRPRWLAGQGLPEDARVALCSGGFNAWVDPLTLVRGMESAMDQEPRLHLVATGGELPGYLGKVYEEFKSLARASRHAARIHPLGWLPLVEANAWMNIADLGLLVDRPCAETRLGARNRLLYYAATGCPVLASRGTEVVADMESAQSLKAFPPADAGSMAAAVIHLLRDPQAARTLGERGFTFCQFHYLFAVTAAPFLKFIANPTRTSQIERTGAHGETATAWIARYLDVSAREAEWSELVRYRADQGGRLRRFISQFRQEKKK